MSAARHAAFYAKGYAEGLRDAANHDVARLVAELDHVRTCLEMERIIRCDYERQVDDLKAGRAIMLAELKTAIGAQWLTRFKVWNLMTFGPGKRTAGTVEHIRRELIEIEDKPDDPEEWVDVALLAINGLVRLGLEPLEILARFTAKLDKNIARKWPDWRTAPDSPIEHVRDEAA